MNTFLVIMFYVIPLLITWTFIYNYGKTIEDKHDTFGITLYSIFIVLSLIPVINIIFAAIVSGIFILQKSK